MGSVEKCADKWGTVYNFAEMSLSGSNYTNGVAWGRDFGNVK